jgi:hypothetical protein
VLKRPASWLLALMGLSAAVAITIALVGQHGEEPAAQLGAVGLGQKHMLVSLHSRRQPSFQLTWNAPDGATGYTVYIATPCPAPVCHAPDCPVICADGGADAGDGGICIVQGCGAGCAYNADAGDCTCHNDAGQAVCHSNITAANIDAGGCSSPAFCCVTYPGTPAPHGQHDGIIVSQCYRTYADGGAVAPDAIGLYIEHAYLFDVEAH